jgi:dihydrofolate reductase
MKVFIIAAISADGFIAKNSHHPSHTWVSKEDTKFFQQRTNKAGVMVMGYNTYVNRGKPYPNNARKLIVYTRKNITLTDAQTTQENPAILLSHLEQEGYKEIALVGGAQIYTMFMQANLVDSIYVTVEPILFGQGIPLFQKPLEQQLKLISTKKLGKHSILLKYNVIKT